MVAYNFKKQFHDPIRRHEKTGTVRTSNRRHARVGEPMQIYGSRGKRLLTPDPICVETPPIIIRFAWDSTEMVRSIQIGRRILSESEIDDWAAADGFALNYPPGTPRSRMGQFWHRVHGWDDVQGTWFRWEPRV